MTGIRSRPAPHTRRAVLAAAVGSLGLAAGGMLRPAPVAAQSGPVVLPDGRSYDAYVPAATKEGQFYSYTCEFDAAWAILASFGQDVPFEEMLAVVGHDTSIEPWWEETADGFVIYGGDITTAYSGDYTSNLLARTTGRAMQPLFERYGLPVRPVDTREDLQAALDAGALAWMKATVDFKPWAVTTWITPRGVRLPTVLGNDHAVVVMGYNASAVVIRDVLGPTDTNWERQYEYDVAWETFLPVWAAQGYDTLAVYGG